MVATTHRPNLALLALEAPRAASEFGLFAAALPLLARAPRGDGHPVLVLPGFLADDRSTRPLRALLRRLGYDAHGWRLGRNLGPSDAVVDGLRDRVVSLRAGHGRTVSIVGWSLGGIYGREIARVAPDAVRQVITLGSPYRFVAGEVPVPSTAVFSRTDGIAPWRMCCDDDDGDRRENVEVVASHCGLGHHPAVLLIVADRLAQPEGEWAPFRPRRAWTSLLLRSR